MNYFEVFGLEPVLNLDINELEKRFHQLSRQYHPDFHTTSLPEERERALQMTALLNDAYRTLREPSRRAEYLVRSRGFEVDPSKVPQALLAQVFEINEEMEELRAARASGDATDVLVEALEGSRAQISRMRADYDNRLQEAFSAWDRLIMDPDSDEKLREQLSRLADIISHSAYIRNMERDIENEVSH
jgi:molecular chaperone HscB